MKQPPLSATQRAILWYMRKYDEQYVACTGKEARILGFGIVGTHEAGGIVFRAYSDPLYFMRSRGFFEPAERNVRGRWYRITEAGQAAADSIREEPKIPGRNSRSNFGRSNHEAAKRMVARIKYGE